MAIDDFWHNLLPNKPENVTFENKSIDVSSKDCFFNYSITACVRNSGLTLLGFASFFFCLVRIVKLHVFRHPQIHQYLIFYSASLEVIFLIVKWMALMSWYQLELVASYLKMIQFLLLCHYHWSLVSRILHQQNLINWIIMPLLGFFLSVFSLITTLGLLTHFSSWVDCLAPHWIVLSFVEFLGIQLYVVAGIYITKKINSTSSLSSFKWEQKRDLWSVIGTYEFSSVISLSCYATFQALGNSEIGCSGIFGHAEEIFSAVYAIFMVIKYLIPIWIMLLVFYPTRGYLSSEDERRLGWSGDGSTTSTFSPAARFQDSYRRLFFPVQYDSLTASNEHSGLRRSESLPALFSKSPLLPIHEQEAMPPARVPIPNYGAMDSCSAQCEAVAFSPPKTRSRHDSGMPSKNRSGRKLKIVSLNQCSDEMESVSPSSYERA